MCLPCHSRGHCITPGHGHRIFLLPWDAVLLPAPAPGCGCRDQGAGRGCALSQRLRRAAPRKRALRPTRPRARTTPCWLGDGAAGCSPGGLGSARRAAALRWTPWGSAHAGARRARAHRERHGHACRRCRAHRDAGMRPARRARAGDRPCIHLVRRSRAHSDPCAAAALCPCGRKVAKGGGLGQTCRSAHRRRGRAANCGGSAGVRSRLDARKAG